MNKMMKGLMTMDVFGELTVNKTNEFDAEAYQEAFNYRFDSLSPNKNNMYPVYIVAIDCSSLLKPIIALATQSIYNHSAISFDSEFRDMFTFGIGNHILSSNNPNKEGKIGFIVEDIELYKKVYPQAVFKINTIWVNATQYMSIRNDVMTVYTNSKDTKYDVKSFLTYLFPLDRKNDAKTLNFMCSSFIAKLFYNAGVLLAGNTPYYKVTPKRIADPSCDNAVLNCYYGRVSNFKAKTFENHTALVTKQKFSDVRILTNPFRLVVNSIKNIMGDKSIQIINAGGFYGKNGTWNSILKLPEDNKIYRGRVETLVFLGSQIYLGFKKPNEYRIPGGSWNKELDHLQQAINECNEEGRLRVKNVIDTGITYKEITPMPKWTKNEDVPIKWDGKYTKVFVAEYDGFYNGKIKTCDKDDLINYGKFYPIKQVYDKLRDEHKRAVKIYLKNNRVRNESVYNNSYRNDVACLMESIKRFNCTNKYEERQHAKEIINAMEKYNIPFDVIGDNNKLNKYINQ